MAIAMLVAVACGGDGGDSKIGPPQENTVPEKIEAPDGDAEILTPPVEAFDAADAKQALARLAGLLDLSREGHSATDPIAEIRGAIATVRLSEICDHPDLDASFAPGCDMFLQASASTAMDSGPIYADALTKFSEAVIQEAAASISETTAHDADLREATVQAEAVQAFREMGEAVRANPTAAHDAVRVAGAWMARVCSLEQMGRLSRIAALQLTGADLRLSVTCLATLDLLTAMTAYQQESTEVGLEHAAERIVEALIALGA